MPTAAAAAVAAVAAVVAAVAAVAAATAKIQAMDALATNAIGLGHWLAHALSAAAAAVRVY